MKKLIPFLIFLMLLSGCGKTEAPPDIAATTLPVFEFTQVLCQDTPLRVERLITESVSCLHDYALKVDQVKTAEAAQTLVISGAGLEEFMEDILDDSKTIDASRGIDLLGDGEEDHADHQEEDSHHHEDGHHHESDPHIWLSPENAKRMAQNICRGLTDRYPRYADTFQKNLTPLLEKLDALEAYGHQQLENLFCRELITFHDGFSYFAQAFDLEILAAVEEESGSEASAKELIGLITLVRSQGVPAIFTETNGSPSAAGIIGAETGVKIRALDMAMAGDSYFDAMYRNIRAIKEAME